MRSTAMRRNLSRDLPLDQVTTSHTILHMKRGNLDTVLQCLCSAQSENLRNLEIALRILRIPRLRSNLEIAHYTCAISRLRKYSAQSLLPQRACAETISRSY